MANCRKKSYGSTWYTARTQMKLQVGKAPKPSSKHPRPVGQTLRGAAVVSQQHRPQSLKKPTCDHLHLEKETLKTSPVQGLPDLSCFVHDIAGLAVGTHPACKIYKGSLRCSKLFYMTYSKAMKCVFFSVFENTLLVSFTVRNRCDATWSLNQTLIPKDLLQVSGFAPDFEGLVERSRRWPAECFASAVNCKELHLQRWQRQVFQTEPTRCEFYQYHCFGKTGW